MLNDTLKITGDVFVSVYNEATGTPVESREIKNLVVSAGKTFIAAAMLKTTTNSPAAMTNMAAGAGTVAASATDTALGSELGRVVLASATSSANVVTYTATFPAGTATGAVTEAGVFNAGSGGTMLCRTVFAVVNKGTDDAMSVTWQITVS